MSEVIITHVADPSTRPGYSASSNTMELVVFSRSGCRFEIEVALLKTGQVMMFNTKVGGDTRTGWFADGFLAAQAKAITMLTDG